MPGVFCHILSWIEIVASNIFFVTDNIIKPKLHFILFEHSNNMSHVTNIIHTVLWLKVRVKAQVLAEMNAFLQKRNEEDEGLRNEIDGIVDTINR